MPHLEWEVRCPREVQLHSPRPHDRAGRSLEPRGGTRRAGRPEAEQGQHGRGADDGEHGQHGYGERTGSVVSVVVSVVEEREGADVALRAASVQTHILRTENGHGEGKAPTTAVRTPVLKHVLRAAWAMARAKGGCYHQLRAPQRGSGTVATRAPPGRPGLSARP